MSDILILPELREKEIWLIMEALGGLAEKEPFRAEECKALLKKLGVDDEAS